MKLEAYAKVNLTLEVFGKRPDGYHALRSFVAPISLSDTIEIEVTDDGSIVSDAGYPDDLCVKAATALREAFCIQNGPGAAIRVFKRIPAGGGLGGGSADAAAVLRGLNDLWGCGFDLERLAEIGAKVGSDVPSLLFRRPVVMEGRGELVAPVAYTPGFNMVVASPGVHCSTAEVYRACVPRQASEDSPTSEMLAAYSAGDVARVAAALVNDLQAPAIALHPEISALMQKLRDAGAEGVMMSGSGSCVFALAKDSASATELAAEMNRQTVKAWAVCTV